MKLKRVDREKDGWQKCCRYCHYYKSGCCWNKNLSIFGNMFEVYNVSEEGHLSQCLEETLNDGNLVKKFMLSVESILDKWKVSQKRKKEFEEHFKECWSEFADFQLKENLDENIAICYQSYLDRTGNVNGFEIQDPNNFVCKDWC